MKKVSFNSRKKVYIVTETGKKGIQAQSKQPPADEPGLIWECENPHKKKDSTKAHSVQLLSTGQNKEGMEMEDLPAEPPGKGDTKVDSESNKKVSSKSGLFSYLFSD